MKASLYHVQLNVCDKKGLAWYKDFFAYINYKLISDSGGWSGYSNGTTDLWITLVEKKHLGNKFHRKASGVNHLAFVVKSKKDVDKFTKEFLQPRKIKPLYNTPKAFPDYDKTYYAVFFEGPDRIKLEICYLKP